MIISIMSMSMSMSMRMSMSILLVVAVVVVVVVVCFDVAHLLHHLPALEEERDEVDGLGPALDLQDASN